MKKHYALLDQLLTVNWLAAGPLLTLTQSAAQVAKLVLQVRWCAANNVRLVVAL